MVTVSPAARAANADAATALASDAPHLFTVDVEEYFQAFPGLVPRERWTSYESRVDMQTHRILDALARAGATGTFFCLGWIATHRPALIRDIANAGHEIASHGYWHDPVTSLTPEAFREDLRTSKQALEDVTGTPVLGYRAPLFSINSTTAWALPILVEEGYAYDSSLFPGRRPDAGGLSMPRRAEVIDTPAGRLLEIPLTTLDVFGYPLPVAGGAYFRHFPMAVTHLAFRQRAKRGESGVFYIHPREIDAAQPVLHDNAVQRLRHYGGVGAALGRIEALLAAHRFASVVQRHERDLSALGALA